MTLIFAALATLALLHATPAMAADPPVPAGKDPGGTAVALLTEGIDYTLPDVARILARDGEGELIGWDFVDNDARPYDTALNGSEADSGGDGTHYLYGLVSSGGARIVPIRVDPTDPMTLARGAAFVARTPARVAVLPMRSQSAKDWELFRQAALQSQQILFVVPGGQGPETVYPAAFGLDNVLAVSSKDVGQENLDAVVSVGPLMDNVAAAVSAVAAYLACSPGTSSAASGRELKSEILRTVAKNATGGTRPIIEPCRR